MKRDPRTILITLGRCLKLRCPVCGAASIVERPFNLKHLCSNCGVIFKREEGFFVGAIMANIVATEGFILLVYFACILFTNLGDRTMLTILFAIGVTFPLAFYHHAWALWLGMDHLIEGLSREPSRP
jgi:rubredoxin